MAEVIFLLGPNNLQGDERTQISTGRPSIKTVPSLQERVALGACKAGLPSLLPSPARMLLLLNRDLSLWTTIRQLGKLSEVSGQKNVWVSSMQHCQPGQRGGLEPQSPGHLHLSQKLL